MKYTLILLLLLSACQSKKESSKHPITGTWIYETIELYDGEKFDTTNPAYNNLHRQHIGLTLSFSGGKTFAVKQIKSNGSEESLGRQNYELPGDTILRLKNTGRPDDEFPVISISDSRLRLNLFNSPYGYIVFRKAN